MPSKKLTRDDFPALLELGKVLPSSLDSEKGIDLVQLINQWTGAVRKGLSEWGAENSFDNLCRAGCSQLSLSLVLFASAISIAFAEKWAKIVGPLRRRERILRALEHAAEALEEMQESLADAFTEDYRGVLDEDLFQMLKTSIITGAGVNWPANASAAHPATTIRSLRLYADVLRMSNVVSDETGVPSPASFSRYILSAYVKRATGQFHDSAVSELIGCVFRFEGYDETAHRMWRSRNYKRMDKELFKLGELLVGIGVVTGM